MSTSAQHDQQRSHIDRLNRRIGELKGIVAERDRRLNQVLGERSELRRILAQREETVRALIEGGRRARSSTGIASFVGLQRLWQRERPAKAPAKTDSLDDAPTAPELAVSSDAGDETPLISKRAGAGMPVIAAVVVGLERERLAGILTIVKTRCAERNVYPLLITDSVESDLFRARELIFEYLPCDPSRRHGLGENIDWEFYLQRRLAIIREKWALRWTLSFGPASAALVDLWRRSPFETSPLKAANLGNGQS